MFDHGLEYLRKKLPEFENKPTPPPPTASASAQTPIQPAKAPPPTKYEEPHAKMLDSIVAFLRHYLICDDYQLNLLALWIVHTYCFQDIPNHRLLGYSLSGIPVWQNPLPRNPKHPVRVVMAGLRRHCQHAQAPIAPPTLTRRAPSR